MNGWLNGGRCSWWVRILFLCSTGPPDNSCIHGGSKHSENSSRWDLWGQLRPICCSGHSHDRHTTEECGSGRRLRRIRRLHTSGLPCCCYSGSHSRRLPDVLILGAKRPLKEHFTIYEEGAWWLSTQMKPESEECSHVPYWNILYTWSFHSFFKTIFNLAACVHTFLRDLSWFVP